MGIIRKDSQISIEIIDEDLGKDSIHDSNDRTMWANGTVTYFLESLVHRGKGGTFLRTDAFWEPEYIDNSLKRNSALYG